MRSFNALDVLHKMPTKTMPTTVLFSRLYDGAGKSVR